MSVWQPPSPDFQDLSKLVNRQALVVTGLDGSGKTRFLKTLSELVDVKCAILRDRPPMTTTISQLGQSDLSTEHWALVWERAIAVSVASCLIAFGQDMEVFQPLVEALGVQATFTVARHPFTVLRLFALDERAQDEAQFARWLRNPAWETLQDHLMKNSRSQEIIMLFDDLDGSPDNGISPVFAAEASAGLARYVASYEERPFPAVALWAAISQRAVRLFERYDNARLLANSRARVEIVWTRNSLKVIAQRLLAEDGEDSAVRYLTP